MKRIYMGVMMTLCIFITSSYAQEPEKTKILDGTFASIKNSPSAYSKFIQIGDNIYAIEDSTMHISIYNKAANQWTVISDKYSVHPSPGINHSLQAVGDNIYLFGGRIGADVTNRFWMYNIKDNTWQDLTTATEGVMPTPRATHASAKANDKLYISGGYGKAGALNDLWEYDTASRTWRMIAVSGVTTPQPRGSHTMTGIGNNLYLFGGIKNKNVFNDLWKYDIVANKWVEIPCTNYPETRYYHTAVASGTVLYIFGGNNNGIYLNDLHSFETNPTKSGYGTWADYKADILPQQRWNHTSAVSNGILYIYGGSVGKDLWAYNIVQSGVGWVKLSKSFPKERSLHATTTIGKDIYLFGGSGGIIGFNDLWKYDTATNVWTELKTESTPPPRYWHTITESGTKLYVFGGSSTGVCLGDLWEYDTESNKWSILTPDGDAPSARALHKMVSAGNKLYLFGGKNNEAEFNDLWEYSTLNNKWRRITIENAPQPRHSHSMTSTDRIIYIFGGNSGGKIRGDLWEFNIPAEHWMKVKTDIAPPERQNHIAIFANNKLFIYGGIGNRTIHKSLWKYENHAWEHMTHPDMPEPLSGHSLYFINKHVYYLNMTDYDMMIYTPNAVQKQIRGGISDRP